MIAWSSMLVCGLKFIIGQRAFLRKLYVSDSSLWLPGTTWAAPLTQPFQKTSCRAWKRSLLLRWDIGTSTWNFTFVLHPSLPIHIAVGSKSAGQNEEEPRASFLSSPLIWLCCVYLLENGHLCDANQAEGEACWVMADASRRCSMSATQINFTSKLFCW